jgi:hypothetical protein
MRAFIAGCILLGLTGALRAAEVELIRVWPGWHDEEDFERISEYFGPANAAPKQGREVVLRTRDSTRAGYYFLVRVRSPSALPEVKFELSVIRPDAVQPITFTLPTSLPARETVYQLGLTGADWPEGRKVHPVAWKLVLRNAGGQILAEHKSFLWEKPAN